MKLGEALQERNHLQQTLTRLQKQRLKLFTNGVHKGGLDYKILIKEIMETHQKINDLKKRIIETNIRTSVTVELDKPIKLTLQEAILEVTTIKSELSEYSKIEDADEYSYSGSIDEPMIVPLSPKKVASKIRELENRKRAFNHAIQGVNWKVSLIDNKNLKVTQLGNGLAFLVGE